jgi:hypothetical protein
MTNVNNLIRAIRIDESRDFAAVASGSEQRDGRLVASGNSAHEADSLIIGKIVADEHSPTDGAPENSRRCRLGVPEWARGDCKNARKHRGTQRNNAEDPLVGVWRHSFLYSRGNPRPSL